MSFRIQTFAKHALAVLGVALFCAPPLYGQSSSNKHQLVIDEVILSPSKILKPSEVQQIIAPFIHATVRQSALNIITDRLNDLYRRKGYIFNYATLTNIDIKHHKLNIKLTEFDSILNSDSESYTAQKILNNKIEHQPFNIKTLSSLSNNLNQLPGYGIEFSATPIQSLNTVLIDFKDIKPRDNIVVQIDNNTNNPRHDTRVITEIHKYNVMPYADMLGARGAVYKGSNHASYAEIFSESWLGVNGLRLKNRLARVSSQTPSSDLGFVAVGNSKLFESSLLFPIQNDNANITGSINVKNLRAESFISGYDFFKDNIASLSTGLTVTKINAENKINANFEITRGIGTWGAVNKNQPRSRGDASSIFTKLAFDVDFSHNFQSKPFVLNTKINGQYAFDPLLSSEEYNIGGDVGRGYGWGSLSGEHGVGGSVEIETKNFMIAMPHIETKFFTFADAGIIQNKKTNTQSQERKYLSSAGIGARARLSEDVRAEFQMAKPIDSNDSALNEESSTRTTFSLSGAF